MSTYWNGSRKAYRRSQEFVLGHSCWGGHSWPLNGCCKLPEQGSGQKIKVIWGICLNVFLDSSGRGGGIAPLPWLSLWCACLLCAHPLIGWWQVCLPQCRSVILSFDNCFVSCNRWFLSASLNLCLGIESHFHIIVMLFEDACSAVWLYTGSDGTVCAGVQGRLGQHHVYRTRRCRS